MPPSSSKPRTRIPTEDDFSSLTQGPTAQQLHIKLIYPSPRESTTSIMIFFHGLGDNEDSFATFARNLNLPGVLGISVRGVSPLPSGLFSDELAELTSASGAGSASRHFHWGDDLRLDSSSGGTSAGNSGGSLDQDPGFENARSLIMNRLVSEILIQKCGWNHDDILLFGFGQGGSLALGLASMLRALFNSSTSSTSRVEDITDQKENEKEKSERRFKGVISIAGALPSSMVPTSTTSSRKKAKTPILICHGRGSETIDEEAIELVREEFENVKIIEWRNRTSGDDGMPRNREEVLPMMQFFAERLRGGWS